MFRCGVFPSREYSPRGRIPDADQSTVTFGNFFSTIAARDRLVIEVIPVISHASGIAIADRNMGDATLSSIDRLAAKEIARHSNEDAGS
jgi:hypothetical protein